jgi:polysaccharide pyruvyl transferase WcaK-like protein
VKIGLIGTYDVDNFGDCAFPIVHREFFRTRIPNAQFTFYSPTDRTATILGDELLKALPAGPAVAEMPEDAFVLTGGETIHSGHSSGTYIFPSSSYSSFLRLWLGPLQSARKSGARFAAHCVGIRLADPETQSLIGKLLRSADFVTLRDRVSQERLSGAGTQYDLAVDPMFALRTVRTDDEWTEIASRHLPAGFDKFHYIVAHVSPPYLANNLAQWVDTIIQLAIGQKRNLLFLPICHFLDDAHVLARAHEIASLRLAPHGLSSHFVPDRIHVLETAAVIGRSSGYVGTSLHGAVTAVSFGLPLAVLTHDAKGKHQQVLAAIGIDNATTTAVDGIAQAFRNTQALDLEAIAASVTHKAQADFDKLAQALQAPAKNLPPLREEDLAAIRQADILTIRNLKERVKRSILMFARRYPGVYSRYRALKNRLTA